MSADPRPPGVLRRAGAVLAGVVAVIVLSVGTDALLFATGVYPSRETRMPDRLFVLATAYRCVYGVAGGYIAARLAPDRPMAHALWYGAVGLAAGIAGAVAAADAETELGPAWYPVAVAAIMLPCAWVGGRLRGAGVPAARVGA